jgi:UDP-GlcNAc:undecaprenyl-phosphate GlcNAc-1-phosphate transferase
LPGWTVEAAVIVLGAALVGVVGLIDDLRTLSPAGRLLAEVGAATIVVAAGVRANVVGGPLDWILAILWLVAITNAFNLLDNMDGAVGIIASVVSLALMVAAVLSDQRLVSGMAALIFGSSFGFLMFNWYPARIFMGDAGSLFLGFLIAAATLKVKFSGSVWNRGPAVLLLAAPALFDTVLVVIARIRSHRPIYLGATDHTSHRLLRLGLGTPAVALLLAAGSAIFAALGLLIGRGSASPSVVTPVVSLAVGVALVLLLRLPDSARPEASEHVFGVTADAPWPPPRGPITRSPAQNRSP